MKPQGTRVLFLKKLPRASSLLVSIVATLLTGCAVGPDFKVPEAPNAKGYTVAPLPSQSVSSNEPGSGAQRFIEGQDISDLWWAAFGSNALNRLIERALKANPNIEVAHATLAQAQEMVEAQRGFFYPSVQASYSPSRTKLAGNMGGNSPGIQGDGSVIATKANTPASQGGSAPFNAPVIYNFHTAQLSIGFVPDVFGSNRRQVESLQAQADTQRFALEAARITLATNLVAAAIQEASTRAQISTVKRQIEINQRALAILKQQQALGFSSGLDVAAQEATLAQTEQVLPPLTRQLEQTRDLIRVLVGNRPDQEVDESFVLDDLHLPASLPLSLPSQLVRQRPDVRAAEEQLHAASANVGVAIADRLPQFSITATAGGEASHFGQMFWGSGKFFSVTGLASQTLLDGGTLLHHQRAAEEALVQAEAQYRATALSAFQNVADTLHAINTDEDFYSAAFRSEQAAYRSFELTRKQLEMGAVSGLNLINAEQIWLQSSLNLVQAKAGRLGDSAALFQALGGGWWNRKDGLAKASLGD